jgi:hypothetical protein
MERYEKKNKENPRRTPRSRSTMFPSLREEILIGGKVDLDLLSLFPQKDARIMGGMEEEGQALNVNNGGEIILICSWLKDEEGLFIPPPKM